MIHPRVFVFVFSAFCLVPMVPLASAQANQIYDKSTISVNWVLTPTEYPCLVEPIRVTGTYVERLHIVTNPRGGYSYQTQQITNNLAAVGLDTGKAYQFSGPFSYEEKGWIDGEDGQLLELTYHNIGHFVGPGDLPDFYIRQLWHLTVDRATGEVVKVEVLKDDALCH